MGGVKNTPHIMGTHRYIYYMSKTRKTQVLDPPTF